MTKHAAVLFALLLCACSAGEPGTPALELDYSSLGHINLDVANINIADHGGGTAVQSAELRPTIADAVRRWAEDRLHVAGSSGEATVIIREANVATQPLSMDNGMGTMFERQQGSKYVGHVAVEISARGREGYASATAEASRSVSLPDNPTGGEKQAAYNDMLKGLMADLNVNLEQAIHDHMSNFIITAPPADSSVSPSAMPVPESLGLSP